MSIKPSARLTVITLGVSDISRSIAFYDALGFARKFRATGEAVAFFEAGGIVLGLFPWDQLAADTTLAMQPMPQAFRGMTLAWNCNDNAEVDAVLAHARAQGGAIVRPAHTTEYGGYAGYFADPDSHLWEVVTAPGIVVGTDGRVSLPD